MPLELPQQLGLAPFYERLPWRGADLQTLRDTLRPVPLPPDQGSPVELPAGRPPGVQPCKAPERLLALLDPPLTGAETLALVVLLHGLGGSSSREGLRRLGWALQGAGFAVLRVNLRGADPGRHLAPGTYAANSNADLLPAMVQARLLAKDKPLLGAGVSLGGTQLLNAALEAPGLLDGLACVSSPLDLAACSAQIERRRNAVYQRWLLQRLVLQTLADPFGVPAAEREALEVRSGPRTIRAFDAAITAPRWGYRSVAHYYAEASPLQRLLEGSPLPPTLLVHAFDDPWVPAAATGRVAETADGQGLQVVLTARGGHNGFHGVGDAPNGCWSDRLVARWLSRLVQG
ncbi:alpha/beta fold hydrolase [Synechococcus sp. FGCU-3]|nr:alpha/beta fold hydrolase [Synechococcus sp. FGCU3]